MNINWPENLVQEIAYRRCVIIIGAGISANSKNTKGESPKTWSEFLKSSIDLIDRITRKEKLFIKKTIRQNNYLLALQTIYDKCDKGKYNHFLREEFKNKNYEPSDIHKLIKEIDSKIVISTNFDKIYDKLYNDHGYNISTHMETEKIICSIKSTDNILIKAHGTIDDTDNIVFTKKQYFEAKRKYPEFYRLLSSLFLTNTVLFLGYSLSDPDINLILEEVANSTNSMCPHYIVVKEGIEDEIKKDWLENYNISTLEYGPNYSDLSKNIENLRDEVISYRAVKGMP